MRPLSPWRTGIGRVFLSLGAALLLFFGGLASYSHIGTPTPVSAQAVLRHAAIIRMPANEAEHLTYAVTVTFPGQDSGKATGAHTGTAEVWIESNGSGTPTISSQTLTLAVKNIYSRYIQENGDTYSYDPELRNDNTILLGSDARIDPGWLVPNHMFDGATVAQYLNQPSQQQGVQLLPQQTLDGHLVDVVQVGGGPNRPALRSIFYFDAHSYLLRGFDATAVDSSYPIPEWRVRLTSSASMSASSAPANAFRLSAPASATVQIPPPDAAGFLTAFESTCKSSINFKQALGSGRTPLAVCRESDPGVTQAELVDALVAPFRQDLNRAVAVQQISPLQAQQGLQDIQARMTQLVTTGLGK
jgi:hypothetical protein